MPALIPGVLYKWISKPTFNPNTGERIPDGYTTILAKFVRTDDSDYFWIMRQMKIGEYTSVDYAIDNIAEFTINKEQLSKSFFVSEADRTGGKRRSSKKRYMSKRRNKKTRRYK